MTESTPNQNIEQPYDLVEPDIELADGVQDNESDEAIEASRKKVEAEQKKAEKAAAAAAKKQEETK